MATRGVRVRPEAGRDTAIGLAVVAVVVVAALLFG
jgi:hypothetical protein